MKARFCLTVETTVYKHFDWPSNAPSALPYWADETTKLSKSRDDAVHEEHYRRPEFSQSASDRIIKEETQVVIGRQSWLKKSGARKQKEEKIREA